MKKLATVLTGAALATGIAVAGAPAASATAQGAHAGCYEVIADSIAVYKGPARADTFGTWGKTHIFPSADGIDNSNNRLRTYWGGTTTPAWVNYDLNYIRQIAC